MMAKVLKKRGVIPDLILSSTAVRAYEFARIIAEETGYKEKDISRRKDIYLADESVMLGILKKVEDKYGVVFLIGHNPDLTYFANRLCNYNLDNIPTSGIVGIEFNTDKWSDVDYGRGIFKSFDYPKKYI